MFGRRYITVAIILVVLGAVGVAYTGRPVSCGVTPMTIYRNIRTAVPG